MQLLTVFTHSFVDRAKDTMKISGAQVSPTEIEDVLRVQPDKLIEDVCVGGVSGGRTSDEKVPRAWVVLSDAGRRRGADQTLQILDDWVKTNLSRYKWLRGGLEVVEEVNASVDASSTVLLIFSKIPKNPTGKTLRRVLQDRHEKTLANAQAKL